MPPRRNEIQENQQRRNEEDMISCLPDPLLHHILSFVDMKLAVQTSILSKRWMNVWASLGSISINANQFYSSPKNRSVLDFVRFVNQVFTRGDKSTTLNVFNFVYYYQDDIPTSCLYDSIVAATQRRVQEMYLRLSSEMFSQVPGCLFRCDSLIAFALAVSVKREQRPRVWLPDSMDLPRLKSLLLGSVMFNNEKLTNKLFLSCPKLERLFLGDIEFQSVDVDIFSHTLVELGVNNHITDNSDCHWMYDSKFKLHAPNLKVLECKDFMSREYILENLNSLIWADVDMKVEHYNEKYGVQLSLPSQRIQTYGQRMMSFLRALHKVENLKLAGWFLEVLSESPELDCQPTQFYSLKCLKLETWLSRGTIRAITFLLQISPILESLFLEIRKIKFCSLDIGENPEAEVPFICLDKLVLVEIRGVVGCVNELRFLEILLKNAKVLKKLVVYTSQEDSPNTGDRMRKFNEKLLTFRKASSDIQILFYISDKSSLQCLLFHLKSVEIRGVVGCANELKFLEMLLKNGMVMEKLVVFTCKEDSTPDREKQLIKLCEAINISKSLFQYRNLVLASKPMVQVIMCFRSHVLKSQQLTGRDNLSKFWKAMSISKKPLQISHSCQYGCEEECCNSFVLKLSKSVC